MKILINMYKYRLKNSKCRRVKPRSDISQSFLIKYQKFKLTKLQFKNSLYTGQKSNSVHCSLHCSTSVELWPQEATNFPFWSNLGKNGSA